jgi:arginine decarboxylase
MIYQPKKVVLTCGVGSAKKQLVSFEMALRDAGIAGFNLVQVSSILPPNVIPNFDKLEFDQIPTGSIVHCVLSRCESNEKNRLISSAIGVAFHAKKENVTGRLMNGAEISVPAYNRNGYGYISEHHSFGQNEKETGKEAEEIAKIMLSTIKGSNNFKSMSISKSAEVQDGWTTVVAVAILI